MNTCDTTSKGDNSEIEMIEDLDVIKAKMKKKATLMQIGGFRPDHNNLNSSWFGKVLLGLPGEEWPNTNGKPMHALCQVNLTQIPYVPEGLNDIELITVFIGPDELPYGNVNGENWCLRTYKNIDELIPLEQVKTGSAIKPFPMKGQLIEEDYPTWDDFISTIEFDIPEEIENHYDDHFKHVPGFKLGGWPTLIQSEIYWDSNNSIEPEHLFQIDSIEKCNFMWGDSGVAYFGRGKKEKHRDEWAIEWQCF